MTDDSTLSYPTGKVIGIIDGLDDMQAGVEALTGTGFATDSVQVLCGPGGLQRLDADGGRKGWLGRLVRVVQNYGPEREQLRLIETELEEGHFAIGIEVPDDDRKIDAARVLAQHGAHDLHYYGEWSIEDLPVG